MSDKAPKTGNPRAKTPLLAPKVQAPVRPSKSPSAGQDKPSSAIAMRPKTRMVPPSKTGWGGQGDRQNKSVPPTIRRPVETSDDSPPDSLDDSPNLPSQNEIGGPTEIFGEMIEELLETERVERRDQPSEVESREPQTTNRHEVENPITKTQTLTFAATEVDDASSLEASSSSDVALANPEPENPLAVASGYDRTRALQLVKLNVVPQFACSSCYINQSCPEFKEGYVCAFNKAFSAFDIRDAEQIEMLMEHIVERNKVRTLRAFMSEELVSGGQLDVNVTRQSSILLEQLRTMRDLKRSTGKVTVSVETSGAGGGILSRLFGAPPEKVITQQDTIIDVKASGSPLERSSVKPPQTPTPPDKMP